MDPAALAELLSAAHHAQVRPEAELSARTALARLKKLDPKAAESIWLRYGEGMTIAEVSQRQGRDPLTIRAECRFGLKWMAERFGRLAN